MKGKKQQTFNDGLVSLYVLENVSLPGDMPTDELINKYTLRFDERTVGYSRYFTAQQNQVVLDKMVRCLRVGIDTSYIAVINGEQFHIRQIQHPFDVVPKVMDMSLERVVEEYDLN